MNTLERLRILVPVLLLALYCGSAPAFANATRSLRAEADTLTTRDADRPDWGGVSVRSNLFYAATATPNLGLDISLGKHYSLGINACLKPWPRWLAWDYATENPLKWRHLLVAPEFRWWPKSTYTGWFFGADLLYAHYNLGAITLPFGAYSVLQDHRLQGDAYAAGLFAGHSWWIGKNWRLELAGGVAAGYTSADRYECAHCGAQVGTEQGLVILPQVSLNIAWNIPRRARKRQQIIDVIQQIETENPHPDEPQPVEPDGQETPVVDEPAPEPQPEPEPEPQPKPRHPLLRPAAEYQPYSPDIILRRSEGAEAVLFQFADARLLREVHTRAGVYDNMPRLDTILAVTRSVLADETIVPVKFQIIGFASIDGGRWGNEQLSLRRAKAVKSYIQSKVPGLSDELFELVSAGEAWSELADELHEQQAAGTSGLTDAEYGQVVRIIESVQDPDERENRLKAADGGAIYQKLLRGFFFDQRSAVFVRIFYENIDK